MDVNIISDMNQKVSNDFILNDRQELLTILDNEGIEALRKKLMLEANLKQLQENTNTFESLGLEYKFIMDIKLLGKQKLDIVINKDIANSIKLPIKEQLFEFNIVNNKLIIKSCNKNNTSKLTTRTGARKSDGRFRIGIPQCFAKSFVNPESVFSIYKDNNNSFAFIQK